MNGLRDVVIHGSKEVIITSGSFSPARRLKASAHSIAAGFSENTACWTTLVEEPRCLARWRSLPATANAAEVCD
jgi:hypothetical protein